VKSVVSGRQDVQTGIHRRSFFMRNLPVLLQILCLAAAVPQLAAAAEEPRHEIEGNTHAVLSFSKGSDTIFQLGAGYSHLYYGWLQATTLAELQTGGGATGWSLAVGPTFNYAIGDGGISNAVYLTTAGGIEWNNLAGSGSSTFAYHVELGKRFELVHGVAWKPAFIVSGVTETGSNPQFRLVPVQFSFHF
jgi:hypothetical protein